MAGSAFLSTFAAFWRRRRQHCADSDTRLRASRLKLRIVNEQSGLDVWIRIAVGIGRKAVRCLLLRCVKV